MRQSMVPSPLACGTTTQQKTYYYACSMRHSAGQLKLYYDLRSHMLIDIILLICLIEMLQKYLL